MVHTWEMEPEDQEFEGYAWLPSEFETFLCYMRHCFKNVTQHNRIEVEKTILRRNQYVHIIFQESRNLPSFLGRLFQCGGGRDDPEEGRQAGRQGRDG